MAKMKAPEGATSASFNGDTFDVNAKTGVVEVPEEAVEDLKSHGFTLVPAQAKGE